MARRVRWLHVLSANGLGGTARLSCTRRSRCVRDATTAGVLTEVGEPGCGVTPSPLERRFEADVDVAPGRILLLEFSGQQALILRR